MKKTILLLSAIAISSLGAVLYAQQIPTQDLVVEYKFDNDNLIETSGSSYNAGGLTSSSVVSYAQGIEQGSSAVSPDGAMLSNVGNITFSGNVKEYVVSFWFKANPGAGDFKLLELKDPASSNGLTIDVLNFSNNTSALTVSQSSIGVNPTGTYNSFSSYLDNEWHHLVVKLVYWTSGGKYYLRTYLDDVEVLDKQYVVSLSNVWVYGGLDIYLPSQTVGNGMSQGLKIDNFRFYEFPITQTDITTLFNEKNIASSCANVVNIPDANFKTALLQHGTTITGPGINPIDTDGDGEICETEAQAYTGKIYLLSQGVSDLTGIESFTALTELNCSSNQLTNIDVSANTSLLTLDCSINELTSLNVANGNNNNMTIMYAHNNPNLTCIQHDIGYTPVPYSQGQGWLKDATASWSANCTSAGIEDFESTLNVSIYPNPTNGDFSIDMGKTIESLTVHISDITGKEVYSTGYTSTQEVTLNLNNSPGVYFVTIQADRMQSKHKLSKK